MLIVILVSSLLFVVGLLLGCFLTALMFRRVFRDNSEQINEYEQDIISKKKEIDTQREALQKLIYQYHHSGLNPKCKRLRGAVNIIINQSKKVREYLVLLERPNHYKYAPLAMKEVDELDLWCSRSTQVCLEIEKEIIESANKFSHLQ